MVLSTVAFAAAQTTTTDSGCPAPGQRRGPGASGPGAGPAGAPAQGPNAPQAQNRQRPAGPPPDQPTGPPRKHLLIWADTRNGIAQHDIGHAMAVIEELGYK